MRSGRNSPSRPRFFSKCISILRRVPIKFSNRVKSAVWLQLKKLTMGNRNFIVLVRSFLCFLRVSLKLYRTLIRSFHPIFLLYTTYIPINDSSVFSEPTQIFNIRSVCMRQEWCLLFYLYAPLLISKYPTLRWIILFLF